ncbi:MAG: hypothetical protein OHK0029_05930 [Armatimonadaceae bacterium]
MQVPKPNFPEPVMPTKIITIYYVCDELLKACGKKDDPQCKLSDAEVMTQENP